MAGGSDEEWAVGPDGACAAGSASGHPSRLRRLGPGLASGIADDDPSAVGTYSQLGAAFGLSLLWLPLLMLPVLAAAQSAATRIGYVTREGLTASASRLLPRVVVVLVFGPIVIANVFTVGADLHAMASSAALVVPAPEWLLLFVLTAGSLALPIFVPYRLYRRVLQWFALSILAYLGVLLAVRVDWGAVLTSVATPDMTVTRGRLAALVAVAGAAVSPYLLVWQASSEAEERRLSREDARHARTLREAGVEALAGILVAIGAALAIVIAAAATLHVSGLTRLSTPQQAARALRPLVGSGAEALFALGILGTGLLAVPVLASSAAYIGAEALNRRGGLGRRGRDAPVFYLLLALATVSGLAFEVIGVGSIRALYWASIMNGIATPGLLVTLWWLACRSPLLAESRSGRFAAAGLLCGSGIIAFAAIALVVWW